MDVRQAESPYLKAHPRSRRRFIEDHRECFSLKTTVDSGEAFKV